MKYLWMFFSMLIMISVSAQERSTETGEKIVRFKVDIKTNHPQSKTAAEYETDYGILILPDEYKDNGDPVPLVIACNGGGGSVYSDRSQLERLDMYLYLVSIGYAVMDMAGLPETYSKRLKIDHNRNMGSFMTVRSYEKGYTWVVENFNIDKNGCFVVGGSNGGLSAINVASLSNIPIKCVAGNSPLLSVKEQAWNVPSGANSGGEFPAYQGRSNIMRIFGMQDVKGYNELLVADYEDDKVGEYDPFVYKVSFTNNKMKKEFPYPIKIWHPIDDNIVPIKFSRIFVDAINLNGGEAYLIELQGGGHNSHIYGENLSYFKFKDMILPLKSLAYEQAVWFSKYSGIDARYE